MCGDYASLPNTSSPDMSPTGTTSEILLLDVDAQFAEMAFGGFLHHGGNGHFLVVVAGRAAGGKGVISQKP